MENKTKSLLNLLYLCCSMGVVMFFMLLFGRLLGAWLAWDVNSNFPFSSEDLFVCLKVSLIGPPIGIVFWFFCYR